jgi:hypothetical protein
MVVILELRVTSKLAEIYGEINKLETTEIEELKFYDYDEKYRPLFGLQAFIVSRDWFEEYDLQKFYLKVKSVEALSDFHLAQLLINFNGSLLKNEVKRVINGIL